MSGRQILASHHLSTLSFLCKKPLNPLHIPTISHQSTEVWPSHNTNSLPLELPTRLQVISTGIRDIEPSSGLRVTGNNATSTAAYWMHSEGSDATHAIDFPEFGLGAFHPLLCGAGPQMSGVSNTAPPSYSDSVTAGQESVYVVTRSYIS
ncbi:hypothetical protein BDR07DRAFT_1378152 [Suillus spraguei]|nr:hypothetical protein BDR07DRAFT_1378152 [Suillus spraguei]